MDDIDVDMLGQAIWFIDDTTSFFCNATERLKRHVEPPNESILRSRCCHRPLASQSRKTLTGQTGAMPTKGNVPLFVVCRCLSFDCLNILCSQSAHALTFHTMQRLENVGVYGV